MAPRRSDVDISKLVSGESVQEGPLDSIATEEFCSLERRLRTWGGSHISSTSFSLHSQSTPQTITPLPSISELFDPPKLHKEKPVSHLPTHSDGSSISYRNASQPPQGVQSEIFDSHPSWAERISRLTRPGSAAATTIHQSTQFSQIRHEDFRDGQEATQGVCGAMASLENYAHARDERRRDNWARMSDDSMVSYDTFHTFPHTTTTSAHHISPPFWSNQRPVVPSRSFRQTFEQQSTSEPTLIESLRTDRTAEISSAQIEPVPPVVTALPPPEQQVSTPPSSTATRYVCTYAGCDKSFVRRSGLNQHILVHRGERPHVCPHCEKSFTAKGTLKSHILIHLDSRPYECEECSKCFRQRTHLLSHIRTHKRNRGSAPFALVEEDHDEEGSEDM